MRRCRHAVPSTTPTIPDGSSTAVALISPGNACGACRGGAGGLIYLNSGGILVGGPTASTSPRTPTVPPTSALASPGALPLEVEVPLSAGTWSLGEGFPVAITFDVPTGWLSCSSGPVELGACQSVSSTVPGVGVAFTIIDNVIADPCSTNRALLDPPVGSSVDDLVAAISSLEGFEATAPTDVTIDGFDGKQFTLTAPSSPACEDMKAWATETRTNGVGAGEVQEMRVLDVGGVRVVIAGVYFPSNATLEQLSALQQVIASIQIQP